MRKLLRAILPVAIVLPLLLLSWSVMTRTANAANNPDWAGNPRLEGYLKFRAKMSRLHIEDIS